MEHRQYVADRRERKTRAVGLGAAAVGGIDASQPWHVLDTVQDGITYAATLGDPGVWATLPAAHATTITCGLAAAGLAQGHRLARTSETAQIRRVMHAPTGWMSPRDLAHYTGSRFARRSAKRTRGNTLTSRDRMRPANRTALGPVFGRVVSGPRRLRWGRRTVQGSWEDSVLVLGEPGTGKSQFLCNWVIDHPGPALVVSTKPEFWAASAQLRAEQGPVSVFDPYSEAGHGHDVTFRFNIVAGCRDGAVASARSEALTSAGRGPGGDAGDFWKGMGRKLLTALLAAADLGGHDLRTVARWIQTEDMSEPVNILNNTAPEPGHSPIEDYVGASLTHLSGTAAKQTASSGLQTASAQLEFMASTRLADALCPAEQGRQFDFRQFLQNNGTLYLVSGTSHVLAPIISLITDELNRTVRELVRENGTDSRVQPLDPPLAMLCDEAAMTLPSVPLHEQSAENRGWGIWMVVATQNASQLREKWGSDQAETLATMLKTHVLLSCANPEDRRHMQDAFDTRPEQHVSPTESAPDTRLTRLLGNPLRRGRTMSMGTKTEQVPVVPTWLWDKLAANHAVVKMASGSPGIIAWRRGFNEAERRLAALRARIERDALAAEAGDTAEKRVRRLGENLARPRRTGDDQGVSQAVSEEVNA